MISEGKVVLSVPQAAVVSRKLSVFYNPVMSLQRDLCILLIKALGRKLAIADVLAGSGVRSMRIWKEARNCVKEIYINDASDDAVKSIKRHLLLNKIKSKLIHVFKKDASMFLLEGLGFDYIDIDPFGSPNPFLDAGVKRLSRNGILAVTATDTSALTGSSYSAGVRKYWSLPLKNHSMHENALRILIRKVQLVGAQYDKALIPIFCHSTQHYVRAYFKCIKGGRKADDVLKKHGFILYNPKTTEIFVSKQNFAKDCIACGPLWLGPLWDVSLVKKMRDLSSGNARALLDVILEESRIEQVGFYDLYRICSVLKVQLPKKEALFKALKKKGYSVASTHFSSQGIRSNISITKLEQFLQEHLC